MAQSHLKMGESLLMAAEAITVSKATYLGIVALPAKRLT